MLNLILKSVFVVLFSLVGKWTHLTSPLLLKYRSQTMNTLALVFVGVFGLAMAVLDVLYFDSVGVSTYISLLKQVPSGSIPWPIIIFALSSIFIWFAVLFAVGYASRFAGLMVSVPVWTSSFVATWFCISIYQNEIFNFISAIFDKNTKNVDSNVTVQSGYLILSAMAMLGSWLGLIVTAIYLKSAFWQVIKHQQYGDESSSSSSSINTDRSDDSRSQSSGINDKKKTLMRPVSVQVDLLNYDLVEVVSDDGSSYATARSETMDDVIVIDSEKLPLLASDELDHEKHIAFPDYIQDHSDNDDDEEQRKVLIESSRNPANFVIKPRSLARRIVGLDEMPRFWQVLAGVGSSIVVGILLALMLVHQTTFLEYFKKISPTPHFSEEDAININVGMLLAYAEINLIPLLPLALVMTVIRMLKLAMEKCCRTPGSRVSTMYMEDTLFTEDGDINWDRYDNYRYRRGCCAPVTQVFRDMRRMMLPAIVSAIVLIGIFALTLLGVMQFETWQQMFSETHGTDQLLLISISLFISVYLWQIRWIVGICSESGRATVKLGRYFRGRRVNRFALIVLYTGFLVQLVVSYSSLHLNAWKQQSP